MSKRRRHELPEALRYYAYKCAARIMQMGIGVNMEVTCNTDLTPKELEAIDQYVRTDIAQSMNALAFCFHKKGITRNLDVIRINKGSTHEHHQK